MASNTPKTLTKADIDKLAWRSTLLQASFNYERMQGGGFLGAQVPALKKIYADDKEGLSAAMRDNLGFMNTHPQLVGFLLGLLISMEEQKEDRSTIQGLKMALFAPLAGIGDALFWFTILPIVAGISASFAMDGSFVGPILFFLVYLGIFLLRIPLTRMGYNLGTKALSKIKESSELISKSATILGITVIGGLIATYVNINVVAEIAISDTNVVNIQEALFDKVFPNLLPMAYTLLMFYLLRNKKVNPVVLILFTFILAIVCSFFGIL
ncbi:PTS N-acetylgalactosamine transporter subunit IID [Erysipelothrix sp. HDW6C]|uniref:PTS galactosamine transporter subunit IID n=1 Tax=Erysipelothrix sp. HDW6C TaxID=2714930 RepID=UPI00140C93AE|nr:PTS galactosamine transporter subunit IID [Erysipelothrix sp. HDW6C]QIK68788.1 PTS N-acetylgalactosamine transporter subunit IID [Erysipelothrix sp. HDW6C]